MRMSILFLAACVLLVCSGRVGGQSAGQVYHRVGPARFTNAVAWGYPDGLLAGSNFVCGVYAGTLNQALEPAFGQPGSYLARPLTASGLAWLWGSVVTRARPVLLQFRVWPSAFGSYEEAVAWSNPSPPVGVSDIVQAIQDGVIIEMPIEVGPVWLSPRVAPGGAHGPLACRLAANSLILSWPTNSATWKIVAVASPTSNAVWSVLEGPGVVTNGYHELTVPLTNAVQFFRLAH